MNDTKAAAFTQPFDGLTDDEYRDRLMAVYERERKKGTSMKATIRGVRYDTDKAILVGGATHDVGEANPSYWRAKLYRQPRSGRYFLVGHGGSMTVFATGERLLPLYTQDAITWSDWYINGKL